MTSTATQGRNRAMAFITLALLAALAATPAAAQSRMEQSWLKNLTPDPPRQKAASRQILPPVEYDRPYPGQLVVTRVATEREVVNLCPKTAFPQKLGCSYMKDRMPDGSWAKCFVIMVADDIIAAAGFTPEIVSRHELGHCNGWAGDHWGARFAP
jgi:hypothetical protein